MESYAEEVIAVMRQQVQATEDVACALQTANLIAMLGEGTWQDVEDRVGLMEQIKERLGLA